VNFCKSSLPRSLPLPLVQKHNLSFGLHGVCTNACVGDGYSVSETFSLLKLLRCADIALLKNTNTLVKPEIQQLCLMPIVAHSLSKGTFFHKHAISLSIPSGDFCFILQGPVIVDLLVGPFVANEFVDDINALAAEKSLQANR
jgi:hypothetical protein